MPAIGTKPSRVYVRQDSKPVLPDGELSQAANEQTYGA